MPIYEFYSPDTHKIYAFLARGMAAREQVPSCPDGPCYRMERVMSNFAVTGRAEDKSEGDAGEEDDTRMEAAMAEMEREMAGMDEDNPDPRRMGSLMRRMSELTGEKLPEPMEEMVRRLEAGEDPDKLEEEFGDLEDLEDFGEDGGEAEGDGNEESKGMSPARFRALLRRRREPARDPELYELADYLPES